MGMCKSMPLYCVRCWWKCVNVCLYIVLAVAGHVSKYVCILCWLLLDMCQHMFVYCVGCCWTCVKVCLYIVLVVAGNLCQSMFVYRVGRCWTCVKVCLYIVLVVVGNAPKHVCILCWLLLGMCQSMFVLCWLLLAMRQRMLYVVFVVGGNVFIYCVRCWWKCIYNACLYVYLYVY